MNCIVEKIVYIIWIQGKINISIINAHTLTCFKSYMNSCVLSLEDNRLQLPFKQPMIDWRVTTHTLTTEFKLEYKRTITRVRLWWAKIKLGGIPKHVLEMIKKSVLMTTIKNICLFCSVQNNTLLEMRQQF